MTFNQFGLLPSLLTALEKQGLIDPMPIQVEALPVVMAGSDAYISSETGTGKTLAYLLPLYSRINLDKEATQVIVVAPTHELALQIHRVSCDLAQNAGLPVRNVLLIGGTSMDRQFEKLKKKPQIVIGSPGRVLELIDKGKVKVKDLKALVIDEADRLLAGDSIDMVRKIVMAAPKERQLIFVSATEQRESAGVIAELSPNLVRICVAVSPVNPNLEHLYVVGEDRDKPDLLRRLLHATKAERAIVFVHRNETAEIVAAKLAHHKISVADLHGTFEKSERKKAMEDFRSGKARVLIASDVAARGLDIPGVTHIFNFDVPTKSKDYLHRVGRSARAGAKGCAISLISEEENRLIGRFRSDLGIELREVGLREGALVELGRS